MSNQANTPKEVLNLLTMEIVPYAEKKLDVYALESGRLLHEANALTKEEIEAEIPQETYLYYTDYRDQLSESNLNTILQNGDDSHIFDNWETYETEMDTIKEAIKDAVRYKEDADGFTPDEDVICREIDEWLDGIRQLVSERDDSNPLKDLCNNTNDFVYYIDLDLSIDGMFNVKEDLRAIKKRLGIKMRDKTHDEAICEILHHCEGAEMRIYFNFDTYEMCNIVFQYGDTLDLKFNGFYLVGYGLDGSGFDRFISAEFSAQVDRRDINLCKLDHYSYTYDICGMNSDWCDKTGVHITEAKKPAPRVKSNAAKSREKNEMYLKAYIAGGCTHGDMDISRHRSIIYVNDFPCGNKCKNCGTFWID